MFQERNRPEQQRKQSRSFDNFDCSWQIEYNGLKFSSPYEYNRYRELEVLERAGEIHSLECWKLFEIVINDHRVCAYECDFFYIKKDGTPVVEEVKGNILEKEFAIKWRLMKALYEPQGFEFRLLRFGKYEIRV